jgi:hypothetical protein
MGFQSISKKMLNIVILAGLFFFIFLMNNSSLSKAEQFSVNAVQRQNPLQASTTLADQTPSEQVIASLLTNDPLFINQWSLKNIGQKANGVYGFAGADISIEPAWEIATGKQQTVAVIDTGFTPHIDLLNKRIGGYNFVNPGASVYDNNNHGTIISGLIAAQANNNQGIAGVAYNSKIMPLKVSNGDATDLEYLTQAINYLKKQNIKIANISFGANGYTRSFQQAFINNPQILFVVAAGNEGRNNQSIPTYPCSLPMENIVCVAASTQNDKLAGWSNYGWKDVDLAAPGENIISTGSTNPYLIADGTSFSSPIVAATAALLQEKHPNYTPVQIKQLLLSSVDKKSAFSNKTVSGGRLNAWRALLEEGPTTAPPKLFIKRLITRNSSIAKFWLSSSQPQSKFECRIDNQVRWSGCTGTPLVIKGKQLKNGYHKLSVRAINKLGQSSNQQTISFFTNLAKPSIKKLTGRVISKRGRQFKVKINIKVRNANKLWCARAGRPFRRCQANNWRIYLKKGNNRLLVKASNQYNNTAKAVFNLNIK